MAEASLALHRGRRVITATAKLHKRMCPEAWLTEAVGPVLDFTEGRLLLKLQLVPMHTTVKAHH